MPQSEQPQLFGFFMEDGQNGRSHRHSGKMVFGGPTILCAPVRVLFLLCSSFLVMTYFLIRDFSVLPKNELHRSLQLSLLQ